LQGLLCKVGCAFAIEICRVQEGKVLVKMEFEDRFEEEDKVLDNYERFGKKKKKLSVFYGQ